MPENIFATFKMSGQGMSVQRMRLNAVANNIANANTTKGADGNPYQREVVVVRSIPNSPFENELNGQLGLVRTNQVHSPNIGIPGDAPDYNTMQAISAKDSTPARIVYDPSHPDADENGYVKMPNINVVTEMVEMITAQRAFEANAGVIEAAKNIVRDSLEI